MVRLDHRLEQGLRKAGKTDFPVLMIGETGTGKSVLARVLRELDDAGVGVGEVGLRHPTLDDVFLTLTGHVAEYDEEALDETDAADVGTEAS